MIYTIGHTESYLQHFNKQSIPKKLGRKKNLNGEYYPGGSVFKTYIDAKKYLEREQLKDYSIFGVLANWDNDTEYDGVSPFNDLLYDSELILLEEK